MLIYSMSVSVDGFIADREGAFGWTAPTNASVPAAPSRLSRRTTCNSVVAWHTAARFAVATRNRWGG